MKELLLLQYAMVQDARSVLFDFCTTLTPADFNRSSENVGNGGSVKSLMVHMCNCYFGWLSGFAAGKAYNKINHVHFDQLSQCVTYFSKADILVHEFLQTFGNNPQTPITGTVAGAQKTLTPLQLFMHVTSHEFHHKGQILTLSRMWGYTPADTDILR